VRERIGEGVLLRRGPERKREFGVVRKTWKLIGENETSSEEKKSLPEKKKSSPVVEERFIGGPRFNK